MRSVYLGIDVMMRSLDLCFILKKLYKLYFQDKKKKSDKKKDGKEKEKGNLIKLYIMNCVLYLAVYPSTNGLVCDMSLSVPQTPKTKNIKHTVM